MMLPAIEAALDVERAKRTLEDRRERIEYVKDGWRVCWPEWEGPRVGGWCEVSSCCAFSITRGKECYHYGAPCEILEISPDGETLIVEVQFPPEVVHCSHYNGERLRLDITQVWAPTQLLIGHGPKTA
jgi:hypothetical protein